MMLAHQILSGHNLLANGLSGAAHFVVTSAAEWNAVFARPASALANKIVEVAAPITSAVAIVNRDFTAAGGPVTIRSADEQAALAHLDLLSLVRGVNFSGLSFQLQGWPRSHTACVEFGTGTFDKLRFINGTSFRHGYGASLADINTAANLPEYTRVDNVRTATTTSATYPLTWQDPAATSGMIEFFNRGSNSVRVAAGGADVVATGTSQLVAAGSRFRFSSLNPTTATHFAVLATANTSEVNARTEVGLSFYLGNAFFASGSALVGELEIRNCLFRDLLNGAKSLGTPSRAVIIDNDFDRIYGDVIAVAPSVGGSARIMRNLATVQFARSGIAENLNGDAGDPHGDMIQMFATGIGTISDIICAGNRMRGGPVRAGATNQGNLISDNDFSPSYTDVSIISETYIGGSGPQIASGESSFPVRDYLIYGVTIVDQGNVNNLSTQVNITTDQGGSVYVGSVIAGQFNKVAPGEDFMEDRTLDLSDAASPAAVFPNLASIATATDRTQIEAALTTAAEGAGLGAVAASNAIDWTTSDPEAVVLWQNVPSGAHWKALDQQEANTLITLPLRKVLNKRPGQTVSVAAGTEWRSVDTNGTTQVQAWTSAPGTIEPGQFIQIRRTSAPSANQTVIASVTINGFAQNIAIKVANAPAASLLRPADPAYFQDAATTPAGISRMTFRGLFWFPSGTFNCKPFAQLSTGCDLHVYSSGSALVTVEDGAFAKMINGVAIVPPGTIPMQQWVDFVFDVDQVARTAKLSVNGTPYTLNFAVASNGVFQTTDVSFLAAPGGTLPVPVNTRAANLSVEFNGAPYKIITNAAAGANADPWKLGTGLLAN